MHVVLDTSVRVSRLAFPGGPPGRIVAAWRAGAISLVASDFLLDELARILLALAGTHPILSPSDFCARHAP